MISPFVTTRLSNKFANAFESLITTGLPIEANVIVPASLASIFLTVTQSSIEAPRFRLNELSNLMILDPTSTCRPGYNNPAVLLSLFSL